MVITLAIATQLVMLRVAVFVTPPVTDIQLVLVMLLVMDTAARVTPPVTDIQLVLVMPLVMDTAARVILQNINLIVLAINMTVNGNGEVVLLTIATTILVWVQLAQLNAVR